MVSPSCAAARRWGWWSTACPFQLLLPPSVPSLLVGERGEASQAIFDGQPRNSGSTNKKLFNKRVCRFGTKFAIFIKVAVAGKGPGFGQEVANLRAYRNFVDILQAMITPIANDEKMSKSFQQGYSVARRHHVFYPRHAAVTRSGLHRNSPPGPIGSAAG